MVIRFPVNGAATNEHDLGRTQQGPRRLRLPAPSLSIRGAFRAHQDGVPGSARADAASFDSPQVVHATRSATLRPPLRFPEVLGHRNEEAGERDGLLAALAQHRVRPAISEHRALLVEREVQRVASIGSAARLMEQSQFVRIEVEALNERGPQRSASPLQVRRRLRRA